MNSTDTAKLLILALSLAIPPSASLAHSQAREQLDDNTERLERSSGSAPSARATQRRILKTPVPRSPALRFANPLKFPFSQLGKGLDAGLRKVERRHVFERSQHLYAAAIAKGYEPLFGGLGTGSGFAFGVNVFWKNFLGTDVRLDVPLRYSTNRYVGLGAFFTLPLLDRERLYFKAGFEYQDRPEEDFFGFGRLSSETDRTNFRLEKRVIALELGTKLAKNLRLGFPVSATNEGISEGEDNRFPDLQQRFTSSQVPGFSGAELVSFGAFLDWDYRDNPNLPTAGGQIYLATAYFRDTDSQDFRFVRYQAEVVQYLPLDEERVFAFRGLAIANDEKGAAEVPLAHKVILGGRETMRGFREFRFHDDNAILFNAEYRWQIWKFADMLLFVDEGQVAPEPGDFSISRFRNSHGLGLRFKSSKAQSFRIDVGHSKEGWRVYISFRPVS